MGTLRDPSTINNVGTLGGATNPTTAQALPLERENQKAIRELVGTFGYEDLTISSGGITPTKAEVTVDTEAGASADDLTTIYLVSDGTTTLHDGMLLKLRAYDPARVVTVKRGSGVNQIQTVSGTDIVLGTTWDLTLKLQSGVWKEIAGRPVVDISGNAETASDLASGSVLAIAKGGTGATNAADARANLGWLSASRDMQAGTVRFWPSLTVPVLDDGLPLGLPLDGAVVSLATYPRLSRVLCPEGDNAWAPNWYRCTAGGVRDVAGGYIKLDDWRGGYPQVLDAGAGRAKSTVLVRTTNSSANITIVNNLSGGGTLIAPYTGSDGIYPGLAISGTGIPSGATVVSVSGTTVGLSAACTATGSSVEATVTGRVLGGWQGDAGRPLEGTFASAELAGNSVATGAFYPVGDALRANSGYTSGGRLYGFRSALAVPTAPTGRPAGPVANAIILV